MNHDLRVLQSDMKPGTRRMYNELHEHGTEFGRDADLEPPSRTECRTQVRVCVPTCAHVYEQCQ